MVAIPPMLALMLWGGVGYLFWDQLLIAAQQFGEKFLYLQQMPSWMTDWFSLTPQNITTALAGVVVILMLIPLVITTALVLTSQLAMSVAVSVVGRQMPQVEKKGKGQFVSSIKNAIIATIIFLVLWILSIPLWVIPGLSIALPLLFNGYLNYKIFSFDCLEAFANSRELKVLLGRKRIDFMILGVVTSSLILIPPLFLILPVYTGLCFARFSLLELQDIRK